jgi:hypothetical protein
LKFSKKFTLTFDIQLLLNFNGVIMKFRLWMKMLVCANALCVSISGHASLVGHWPLDGSPVDLTGRHAAVTNGVNFSWQTSSNVAGSGSLWLNTNNLGTTWLQISNQTDLQFGTNDFSVSFWVKKLQSTVNYYNAYGVDKWDTGANPGQNEWSVVLTGDQNDDKPTFGVESGTTIYSTTSPTNIVLNAWHHLAAVRRQAKLELYVNGLFASSQDIPAGTAINNAGRDLYFGASQSFGYGADSIYDDIQIYDHALNNGGVSVGQTAGGEVAFLNGNPGQEIPTLPNIRMQPVNQVVPSGSNATFSVLATGNPTLTYQWRFNTNVIDTATNATLVITNVDGNKLGFYDVIITDPSGSVTSSVARLNLPGLTIELLPSITVQGVVGANTRIEWSGDLSQWNLLTNFTLPTSPFKLVDWTASGQPHRFYRAIFQ